jgi:hypothetical protein
LIGREDGRIVDTRHGRYFAAGSVPPRAASDRGAHEFIQGREARGAGDHAIVLAYTDQRAPQRNTAHERLGAVDRIDDPPAPGILPNGAQLFAQHPVLRESRADPVACTMLGRAVGDGHRRAIGLLFDGERRREMTECDRARGAGHVADGLE